MDRLNLYSNYLKKEFGQKVQKISVDIGMTCPNRDGKKGFGGCTFCNNDSFFMGKKLLPLSEQVDLGISYYQKKNKNLQKFLVYFQSYTNTYAPLDQLKKIYEDAINHPNVMGIVIGTRPDCVTSELITYLNSLCSTHDVTIEYGVESMSDETLKKINRGHTVSDLYNAVDMTVGSKVKMGTHLILGFPWEQKSDMIKSASLLTDVPLTFIKFHQLHIVKNTVLGREYLKNPFPTLSKNEYMEIMKEVIELLPPTFVIQRLFGQAPRDIMLSPHWPERMNDLMAEFMQILERENSYQGKNWSSH